ncbi:hypothetical protein CMV_023071 [Castanea mollissima]|uniref:Uncharacterized protein n=1 Tax=Castanea mollissima TaxID=60419 RepID=A0A8J4QRA4_9ROSI|nr:hypothetical protein CMV_023071 [Castanea mollissima]
MAGRQTESDSESITTSGSEANLSKHYEGFNSNAAVSLTIILEAFYGILKSLNAALDLAIKLKDSILEALHHRLNRDEALVFFEAFHGLLVFLASFLTALIGLHFPVLGVSPLDTHFAIILLFIMATIVHGIAYVEIKLLSQDAEYLPILSPRRRHLLSSALADAVFSLQSLSEARRRPTPTPSQLSQAHRRSTSAHAVEALNSLKLAAAGPYRLQRHRSTADQLRPTPINPLGLRPTPISPLSSPPISPLFHFRSVEFSTYLLKLLGWMLLAALRCVSQSELKAWPLCCVLVQISLLLRYS